MTTLNWQGNEARSENGDLYSIGQLSENVYVTYWNGTAFPGWKQNLDLAKAVAQNDVDEQKPSKQLTLEKLREYFKAMECCDVPDQAHALYGYLIMDGFIKVSK